MKFQYFIFLLLLFVLVACSSSRQGQINKWMESRGKIRVVATVQMTADLVAKIGGEEVACLSLISNGLDPHSYELVKGDDELLYTADAIFAIGLGLEHGASLSHLLRERGSVKFLGEELFKMDPRQLIQVDGTSDPHIWMDLALFSRTVPFIVECLTELRPEYGAIFKERGDLLIEEMMEEHRQIYTLLQSIESNKRYLVTTHDAFNYFTRAYLCDRADDEEERRQRCVAPEGLAPDMQLSFYDIQRVIDHLEKFDISKIFTEANLSKDALLKIVQAASARGREVELVLDPLYGDSVMIEGIDPEKGAYLSMISHNAKVFYENMHTADPPQREDLYEGGVR